MSPSVSRVATEIDFDQDGKQAGYLRVPHSTDKSGWGHLMLSIFVIKNGAGPTILLTGANHGDEFEGPVALSKLARELTPEVLTGRVIIVPILNLPAYQAGKRLSPVDGLNLNRTFPGRREGSVTEVIAHYVSEVLVPLADVVVDIHSGGNTMDFMPSILASYVDDEAVMARTLAAVRAFGAPVGLIIEYLDRAGYFAAAVESRDKIYLGTEIGGVGRLTAKTLRIAHAGLWNLLRHFDVTKAEGPFPPAAGETRLVEIPDSSHYCLVEDAGVYEPFFAMGDQVNAEAAVGQVHFIEHLRREPVVVRARRSGLLICERGPGRVEPGDVVAAIARDFAGG